MAETITPSVARYRQLLAAKKLQRTSSPTNNENCHPNQFDGTPDTAESNDNTSNDNHDVNNTPVKTPVTISNLVETSYNLDTSTWAMLGNHLDETGCFDATPDSFKSNGGSVGFYGGGGYGSEDINWQDMAGMTPLDFNKMETPDELRGEELFSPFFDLNSKSMPSTDNETNSKFNGRDNEADRSNDQSERGVKWAPLETPKNTHTNVQYRKSPFVKGTPGTPSRLNESAVISDDEASVDEPDEKEVKADLFEEFGGEAFEESDGGNGLNDSLDSEESHPLLRESPAFEESFESNNISLGSNSANSSSASCEAVQHVGLLDPTLLNPNPNNTSPGPTKQALSQRLKFLTTEVRFADQTCIELSTKLKSEQSKSALHQHDLTQALSNNDKLVMQHQALLEENAKLKVMMEGMKQSTAVKVDECRNRLIESEEIHKSTLLEWEQHYENHLKHANGQISALNQRLEQSLEVNSSLQQKLDKWEARLIQDKDKDAHAQMVADHEQIIDNLKDRLSTAETSANQSNTAIQSLQTRLYDMQSLLDQKSNQIQRERNERSMIEADRDELLRQVEELHECLVDWQRHHANALDFGEEESVAEFLDEIRFTPVKNGRGMNDTKTPANTPASNTPASNIANTPASKSNSTPTMKLLTRTLHSEQKRLTSAINRATSASSEATTTKLHLSQLQSTLSELRLDYEEVKADNELLEEDLHDKCLEIQELKCELVEKEGMIGSLLEEIEVLVGSEVFSKESVNESAKESFNYSTDVDSSRDVNESRASSRDVNSNSQREQSKEMEDSYSSTGSSSLYTSQSTSSDHSNTQSMSSSQRSNARNSSSLSMSKTSRVQLNNTIEDLEGRLEVTQRALESTEEELLATRRKAIESETLVDEMAAQLESRERELAEAKEQIIEYDTQFASSNKELDGLTRELQETKDFSEFQARTISATKTDVAHKDTCIREFSIQLKSSLQALMKVEKILCTYEDSDDLAKKKLGEQSRKIVKLEETIKAINDHLKSSARDVESASTQTTPVMHLLAQSPMSNMSSVEMDSPGNNARDGFYHDKLNELRNELDDANQRCEEIEKERDEISDKMRDALRCLEEFRNEMRQQEEEYNQESDMLSSQVDAVSAQKEELAARCTKLEAKLTSMTAELATQKAQSHALVNAQNEASRQVAVVLGNNSEVLTENESLRTDLQSLELELQNANALLRASNEEIIGSHNNVKATKAAFECLQAESKLAASSLKKREEQANELRTLLAQKERELKEMSETVEDTQEVLESERKQFDLAEKTKEARHQEEVKSLQVAIHDLEFQMAEMEELNKTSGESFQNASERIKVLENMIESKKQECNLYKAECEDLNALVNEKQNELSSLENNLAGAEEELSEERGTTHDQMKEIELLRAKSEEDRLCMSAYEESIVDYKKQIHELQSEISDLQRELEEVTGNYQSIVYEKDNQIDMLKSACANRQHLFDEQLAKSKQERDSTTSDFNAMIKMLQDQLHSKEEAVNEAKAAMITKENLLIEKDNKIEHCLSVISDLKDELLEQSDAQNQLEKEMVRKEGLLESLQNDLNEAEEEIASTTSKLLTLEVSYEELVKSKAAVQRELESSMMDIERMKTLHQDDQSTSNSLIKDLEREIDSLYSQQKETENNIKSLTEELNEANEKLQLAEQQLQQDGETQTKQHHDINELLAQNTTLNKKCNLFKEKMKQLTSKLHDWETSYKLQSKDLVDYGREISRLTEEKNTLKKELLAVHGSSERYKSKLNRINQTVNTPGAVAQPQHPATL